MTPERDGDTVMDAPDGAEVASPVADSVVTVAADVAVGALPAPRPEVLARVLDGLRDLPDARPSASSPSGAAGRAEAMPLPRRRS